LRGEVRPGSVPHREEQIADAVQPHPYPEFRSLVVRMKKFTESGRQNRTGAQSKIRRKCV
jgi:hypothetical protein